MTDSDIIRFFPYEFRIVLAWVFLLLIGANRKRFLIIFLQTEYRVRNATFIFFIIYFAIFAIILGAIRISQSPIDFQHHIIFSAVFLLLEYILTAFMFWFTTLWFSLFVAFTVRHLVVRTTLPEVDPYEDFSNSKPFAQRLNDEIENRCDDMMIAISIANYLLFPPLYLLSQYSN